MGQIFQAETRMECLRFCVMEPETRQWRERAARLRELADLMESPTTRENLTRAAQEYEQMAVDAERREQEAKGHLLS